MANSRFGLRTRIGQMSNVISNLAALDDDARLFIDAVGITDTTIINAINQLVVDLKGYSIWSKCYAIYPLVNGSATSHKWNLKDARDLDAAYRLTFSGGITHNANGADFNGTTGYADTFLNISSSVSGWHNDHHYAIYLRTQQPSVGDGWHIGVGNTATGDPIYGMAIRRFSSSSNDRIYDMGNVVSGSGRLSDTTTDARGFYIGTATASNSRKLYRNGSAVLTRSTTVTGTPSNGKVYIGSINPTSGSQLYLQGQMAFVSIGQGLTDTDATNYNTAVSTFQSTLGRQV